MFISATAPRRKATTYGKSSRRPVITAGNAFAKAAGTDVFDVQNNLVDWSRDSINASRQSEGAPSSHVRLETSAGSAIPESTKLTKQNHLMISTASYIAEDEALFDVPSSEDDRQQNPIAPIAGSRKRRKISPKPFEGNGPLVYDDASLQRHIAAESQLDLICSPSCSMEIRIGNKGRRPRTLPENGGITRSSTPEKQRDAPKARMPCRQDAPIERCGMASLDKATKELSRAHSVAERRPKRYPNSHTSPRKKRKVLERVPKTITKSTPLEARSTTPVSGTCPSTLPTLREGESKGRFSSQEPFRPRNTPPIPTKDTEEITTPRQRQLWDKLLVEDSQIASPSTLDLPRPTLAHQNYTRCRQLATVRKVKWDDTKGSALESRPRKIVDTLHPCDHGQNNLADGSNQDSDSACSDSVFDSVESDTSDVNGAITVQTSPSADSRSRVQQSHVHALSNTSEPVSSLHGAGLKVTYSRQRSYLTDNDLDEMAMLRMSIEPEPTSSQGIGRKRLGQRPPKSHLWQRLEYGSGNSHDAQGGAMRSIHELREAGGNVRSVGELEAILDDIEERQPASRALRRTRLLDLVAKLQEPSICRLFIDQGLETRLLAYAGVETDQISNSLLAVAILELIAGPTSTLLLSQISNAQVVDFLISLLELDQDLASQAKLRGCNLSRYALQEYTKVCTSVSQSAAWRAGKPTVLTCHVLALQCLEYLVRQIREAGTSSIILSAYAIRRIVACSIPPATVLLPQLTPTLAIHVELTVSILESCTISNVAECQESLWEGETLRRVLSLLPLITSWREDKCATSRTLTLRLYCNLTNNSPGLCEDFSTPNIVEALFTTIIAKFEQLSEHSVKQQQPMLSDTLILSLGVFINLAESSSVIRQMVMVLRYGPHSYLDVLIELFVTKSKNAAEVRGLRSVGDRYTDFY